MTDRQMTPEEIQAEAAQHGLRMFGDGAFDPTSTDYAMYTSEGNGEVAAMISMVREKVGTAQGITAERSQAVYEAASLLTSMMGFLQYGKHPEVRDTMVRETIFAALEDAFRAANGEAGVEALQEAFG